MAIPNDVIWAAPPHTLAKHEILKKYLQRWMPIISKKFPCMLYIDGFSGPGVYSGGEPGSPIIALRVAKSLNYTGSILFVLSEEREDRVRKLEEEIEKEGCPIHISIDTRKTTFQDSIMELLEEKRSTCDCPTFTLIDPFGFSGIPYVFIEKLMKRKSSECMISFMAESLNRWLKHPEEAITSHIAETFGTGRAVDIVKMNHTEKRVYALRDLYLEQMQRIAKYCRYFEMKNAQGKVVYYLFFLSNNSLGYEKMKDAMWAVDPSGTYSFSDATDKAQEVLFSASDMWMPIVEKQLFKEFEGQLNVPMETVTKHFSEKTIFLEKHLKEALRKLEQSGRISPHPQKRNGKTRIRGTFPDDVILDFSRRIL
jgi:three-Cys-motif partner protein